jgi:MFS family permease
MSVRLDACAWRPIHTRIVLALGIGWALDSFEIQIVGSVIGPVGQSFHLSAQDQTVWYWTVWFLGLMAGALGFGYLADRVGRRRLFSATLLLYSTAAILTAVSWGWAPFLGFRFLTALGVGGEYSAVTSAMSEFVPARLRGRTGALVMNFWSLGGILAGVVGIVFIGGVLGAQGWRYVFLFGAVSALYGLYVRRVIPESPRWLAARGRTDEANRVIEMVSGIAAEHVHYESRELQPRFRESLAELWRSHRSELIYGMALDFSEASAYYGIFSFISVFVLVPGVVNVSSATVPWYFVVANLGALAGGLMVAWALERHGRRRTVLVAYAAAALSTLLLAFSASEHSPALTLAAMTVAVLFASAAWMSAYPTFSELFPTHLRATAVGAIVGVGRIGAIVGVVALAETASSFGLWSAFLTLSGLWGIGAVAAAIWRLRGREGAGVALEALAHSGALAKV